MEIDGTKVESYSKTFSIARSHFLHYSNCIQKSFHEIKMCKIKIRDQHNEQKGHMIKIQMSFETRARRNKSTPCRNQTKQVENRH